MEQKQSKTKLEKLTDKMYDLSSKWYMYLILYIICLIGTIIFLSSTGVYSPIPAYPESTYQHLEQELHNIIVENDDVYIENLQDKDITYSIEYTESSTSEGQYKIVLEKGICKITLKTGKVPKKEQLVIERNYEDSKQYIKKQYITLILATLLLPIFPGFILCLLYIFISLILLLILVIHKKLSKIKS